MKRDISELRSMQALPLDLKVSMTKARIRQWVKAYGEDGCYVSFSGGKDSTVLLHLVRSMGYNDIPAVFVDVPTQYPELRTFAQSFENVTTIRPKISFIEVCKKHGFPLISKEVSECVYGARRYLREVLENVERERVTLTSIINSEELASTLNHRMKNRKGGNNQRLAIMLGMLTKDQTIKANIPKGERSNYAQTKWQFFLEAPFEISNRCCTEMKKKPAHAYTKQTGRYPITGEMAEESRLRTQKWLEHGCNGFDMKIPTSKPMSFWTEQDVLQYIVLNKVEICSVYGQVVAQDKDGMFYSTDTLINMGFDLSDYTLTTTQCKRTGCMLCGFGCHLEKGESRLQLLKKTHPGMYGLLDKATNNGMTFREAIDWVNEHNGKGTIIRY